MIDNLTTFQREKLEDAIRSAYDYDKLRRMLRLRLGFKIEDEMNIARGYKAVVSDLVEMATDGWLDKLLLGAQAYNGQSFKLKAIATELGVSPPELVPVNGSPAERLEKIVRKRAPFLAYDAFTQKLNSIGPRICRIEYPDGKAQGTGWLAGPDLLITAFHVIKDVAENKNGLTYADIVCRFNYTTAAGAAAAAETTCGVAENWLIDKSPFSQADLSASNAEPGAEELDYAVIRLAKRVGDDVMPGGDTRGWIEIPASPAVMSTDDFMIIAQHPQGRALELAFGEVLSYNTTASRLRYDINTEPGSSGSPCFDITLAPVGVHHASGPAKNLTWNQCVPLRQIILLMKSRNVYPF